MKIFQFVVPQLAWEKRLCCCWCCEQTEFIFFTQLIYHKLPMDIAERHVLLLDPVLGTG